MVELKTFRIAQEDGDLRIPKRLSNDIKAGKPLKIIIRQSCSPGDILTLTAAVRDLALAYPNLQINPKTTCEEIWKNNKHITDFPEPLADIDMYVHYNLVHNSNNAGKHMIHAFKEDIETRLDVEFPLTQFKCDVHLSDLEKQRNNQASEMFGFKGHFWLINTGYKSDYPLKSWLHERWQEVVDHFKGRVRFVQVGAISNPEDGISHHHGALDGTLNMIGYTNLRQLIRLSYFADGALGHVSMLNHLMSAWEKPSIVVAGGRETATWEAYNSTSYLHTIGSLRCCKNHGCWRSSRSDCDFMDGDYPRCMHMIKTDEVIRTLEKFYEGGRLKYLEQ